MRKMTRCQRKLLPLAGAGPDDRGYGRSPGDGSEAGEERALGRPRLLQRAEEWIRLEQRPPLTPEEAEERLRLLFGCGL